MIDEIALAKINLFLDVIARRADGYHEIGTVFQSISVGDTLSGELAETLSLSYGVAQDYPVEKDLVFRAAVALKEWTGCALGAHLHLDKVLPLGAGLGGGSADAAAALRLLNRLWELGLAPEELEAIGAKLGADVPFMVRGGTARATGIGELLAPLPPARLPVGAAALVATPHCAVPTAAAYGGISPSGDARWRRFQYTENPLDPNFDLFNKFEETVFRKFPEILALKQKLLDCGAKRALMSGSGASVFAFFEDENLLAPALEAVAPLCRFASPFQFC
jgi:4-diphosphocytidyl-2-C-methyl-D-erythritol kinase